MKKIAHYHNISDKGLELISKIAYMNDSVRELLTNSSEEQIIKLAEKAKSLEDAMSEYRATLIDSFSALSSGEESEEIVGFDDGDGLRV